MDSREVIRRSEELLAKLGALTISDRQVGSTARNGNSMDAANLKVLLDTAINQAVQKAKEEFQTTINDLTAKVNSLQPPSAVEEYREIEIRAGVQCDETLDIVKSVPEFKGDSQKYVSWRQAAITAHKLFEPYEGSSKYYQVVAILRNKVIGSADAVLSAYNTVLNFKAIIARLDFTYMDKKSIFTLEQELSTLRQDHRSIVQFYDEVERKLTAIVNKVIMSYEGDDALIRSLNQKYRNDALRVFVSGLRKPLCDTLFSCKPSDLPTALALSQELETNQNRYHFAAIYNNGLNKNPQNPLSQLSPRQNLQNTGQNFSNQQLANPRAAPGYFVQRHNATNSNFRVHPNLRAFVQSSAQDPNQQGLNPTSSPQPVDTDVSMRTLPSNRFQGFQAQKRDITSDRQVPTKIQRVNNLGHEVPQSEFHGEGCDYQDLLEDQTHADLAFEDEINFLEGDQYSPTSRE